jgi:hypothetical protein
MGHKYANILETVGNTPVVKINKLAPPNINLFVKVPEPLSRFPQSLPSRHQHLDLFGPRWAPAPFDLAAVPAAGAISDRSAVTSPSAAPSKLSRIPE